MYEQELANWDRKGNSQDEQMSFGFVMKESVFFRLSSAPGKTCDLRCFHPSRTEHPSTLVSWWPRRNARHQVAFSHDN